MHYVEGSLRFSHCSSVHYINGWCRIVVVVNSPLRVDARSEQVIASIVDDSRCGMRDVAFRTALPIGGFSCLKLICQGVKIIAVCFLK